MVTEEEMKLPDPPDVKQYGYTGTDDANPIWRKLKALFGKD